MKIRIISISFLSAVMLMTLSGCSMFRPATVLPDKPEETSVESDSVMPETTEYIVPLA